MKSRSHAPSPGVWTLMIVLGLLVLWEVAAAGGTSTSFSSAAPPCCGRSLWTWSPAACWPGTCPPPDRRPGWASLWRRTGHPGRAGVGDRPPGQPGADAPGMTGLNGLPKLALGPLFIIWFGLGLQSKVLISALMVFFHLRLQPLLRRPQCGPCPGGGRPSAGGSRWQVLGKVIWPACLPWLLASLRTGLGLALSGAIVGSTWAPPRGWAGCCPRQGDVYNAQRVLCCVLVLVVIIVLLDGVVRLLERRLLRWQRSS